MNNVKVVGTIAMLGISGLSSLGSFIYSEYKNRKKIDEIMAKLQSSNEKYYKEKCEELHNYFRHIAWKSECQTSFSSYPSPHGQWPHPRSP